MFDLYHSEELFRMEQTLLDQRNLVRAKWHERVPVRARVSLFDGARRRLAQALLLLADRLDPRAVVQAVHSPSAPTFNGTLHHA